MTKILRVDASGRHEGSVSRMLGDQLLERLAANGAASQIVHRDLADGIPFVDPDWIAANFTPEEERSVEHKAALAYSDGLVGELEAADILVIASPIYNFGVPAALKAWIDMIARARKTFKYTESGPVGLLTGKKAYVMMASGGTALGSEIDFASGYLRFILGFIGIDDVTFIAADQLGMKGEEAVVSAKAAIGDVPPL